MLSSLLATNRREAMRIAVNGCAALEQWDRERSWFDGATAWDDQSLINLTNFVVSRSEW